MVARSSRDCRGLPGGRAGRRRRRSTPNGATVAAQRGDSQTVQALLNKKVDVNAAQADGATALHWAAYRGDAASAAALIRAKANVNARNNYGVTPLALAAQQG